MKRKDVPIWKKLLYLSMALAEVNNSEYKVKYKTDIIGIACQYSSKPKLKREDFIKLCEMPLSFAVNYESNVNSYKLKNTKNSFIKNE